jgi:hypothetical protein
MLILRSLGQGDCARFKPTGDNDNRSTPTSLEDDGNLRYHLSALKAEHSTPGTGEARIFITVLPLNPQNVYSWLPKAHKPSKLFQAVTLLVIKYLSFIVCVKYLCRQLYTTPIARVPISRMRFMPTRNFNSALWYLRNLLPCPLSHWKLIIHPPILRYLAVLKK